MNNKNEKKTDILFLSVIFLLPVLYFLPLFLNQRVFLGQDVNFQNLPLRIYIADQFKQGRFPLWAPEILSGFPIFAESQGGVLYPLNLMFLFLNPSYAYNISFILHLSLAGCFFYLFVRLLVQSPFTCFLSAISFMFCGFFLLRANHINLINALVWAPLLLFAWEWYVRKKSTLPLILCSFILALSCFAGHPPSTLRILILFIGYALFQIIHLRKMGLIFPLLISLLLFLAFSSIQLLPLQELVSQSIRSKGLTYDVASKSPLSLLSTYTAFVHPGPFGHKSTMYIGILPFAFTIVALSKIQNKEVWFWAGAFLVSLLLALGGQTPLYPIVHLLPIFSNLRAPEEFIFLSIFSVNILFAMGYSWFHETGLAGKHRYVHGIIFLIVLIDMFPWNFHFKQKTIEGPQSEKIPGTFYNTHVDNVFDVYLVPPSVYNQEPNVVRFLKKDSGLYRVDNASGTLLESSGLPFGIAALTGTTPLRLSCYDKFLRASYENLKLTYLLNVKYVITSVPQKSPHFKQVYSGKGYHIYQMKTVLPRLFLVHDFEVTDDEDYGFLTFADESFDPQKTVVLSTGPEIDVGEDSLESENVNVEAYEPTQIKLTANLRSDGILVLTDTFYPGWKVYVNDKPQKLLRANLCFRAVTLVEGKHRVVFRFESQSFRRGALVSVLSFSTCLIWLLIGYIYSKKG